MKKIFIICSIFFSFFFISNIKALTVNAYYDGNYAQDILENNPVSDIDNILIPYIESNFDNYYVYIGLSNPSPGVPTIWIRIMEKNQDVIPANRSYLRQGYSSGFYFTQAGGVDQYGQGYSFPGFQYDEILFNTDQFPNYNGVPYIINYLEDWLQNPTWFAYAPGSNMEMFPLSITLTNDSVSFLDEEHWSRDNLPYYMNTNTRLVTSQSYLNYTADYVVHYDNHTYTFTLNDDFPTYYGFINNTVYVPPTTNDLGNNQFGYTANQIKIADLGSHAIKTINCPLNTAFKNDFCYTDINNYSNQDNFLNSQLMIDFNLPSAPPFYQDHYYILTYRVHSQNLYLPVNASINSGLVSMPIHIKKVNVVNNGLYKDIQIVLKATQSFGSNEPYSVQKIGLVFPSIASSEPDQSEWYYGIYRTYKLSDFGSSIPTTKDLEDDYKTNDIDSVFNSNSNETWFNKFKVNDRGLSTIITAPVRLFQEMRETTCQDIVLPVPHIGNITLPCISSIFSQKLGTVLSVYQIIMSGIICYYIGLNYFRIIKNAFTPDDDRIEVQDL